MRTVQQIRDVFQKHHVPQSVQDKATEVLHSLGLLDSMVAFDILSGHGMTNSLYLFETANGKYLLRIPGSGTAQIINRQHEKDVYRALRGSNLSDKVLYINAETGIKICTFLEDSHTCDAGNEGEVRILVGLIRRLHEMNLTVPHEFNLFEEIEKYENELIFLEKEKLKIEKEATAVSPVNVRHTDETAETDRVNTWTWGENFEEQVRRYPDFLHVRERVLALRPLIEKGSGKKCLCHIDAVQDNCLIQNTVESDSTPEAHLIDWEYAGMCDPYIDVAMFNLYAGATKEKADFAIEEYLQTEDSPQARRLIYAYMAGGAYLWVIWSEIKRISSVDFTEYEDRQYALAKEFCAYAEEG